MADVYTVGVLGTGIMGGGLAEVAARAGHEVVLRSRTRAAAEAALKTAATRLDGQVAKGKLDTDERDAIVGRIAVTDDLTELANCDLVIESIVEDHDAKEPLFRELDALVKPDAVLATNTSTLSVSRLALATQRPGQVCGIHFFNPAPVMRLVEIVRPVTASDDTIERAVEFAQRCGKEPIVVADHAGFVVNALLFPYLNAAVRMLERGTASMEAIDAAMPAGCGFPMGPFALLDLVGLDTSMAILDALHADTGDPATAPATTLRAMVAEGCLGRKTGRGFYTY